MNGTDKAWYNRGVRSAYIKLQPYLNLTLIKSENTSIGIKLSY